jgi:hypothetical protein
MAHEGLERPRVDASGGQSIASSVPQHVSVDREWQLPSSHAKPLYELLDLIDRSERNTKSACGCSRRSARNSRSSIALQALDARRAVLAAADIDSRGIKMDLLPADVHSSLINEYGCPITAMTS